MGEIGRELLARLRRLPRADRQAVLKALGAPAPNGYRYDREPEDEEISAPEWPEPLPEQAFAGLAGEFVCMVEPHSEADPAALLTQFLVAFGSVVGRGPHFTAEADRHGLNLFLALVGATAKGRKGSSWGHVLNVFRAVDPDWESRVMTGLRSGEGLIWAVRDPILRREPVKERGRVVGYQMVEEDPGVEDKRLLVVEPEFAATLKVLSREGNTLSPVIRQAWDTGDLRTLVKNSPAAASGAHISIIAHVTKPELLKNLEATEASNGFANRFLWICVRRSKLLPEGGEISRVDFAPLVKKLKKAVEFAKTVDELRRDEEARELWGGVYPALSEGKPGLLGAVIARAEAQVMRLACIYALLDCCHEVRREHLEAALALWDYAEASARFIFGEALGDPVADRILEALRQSPEGLTRTEIYRGVFGCNVAVKRITAALETLLAAGLVKHAKSAPADGKGRPEERWFTF